MMIPCLGTSRLSWALLFCMIGGVALADPRPSTQEVAEGMIKENEGLSSVNAKFQIIWRTWYTGKELQDLQKQRESRMVGLDPPNKAAAEKRLRMLLEGIRTKGFDETIDHFEGVVSEDGRFHLFMNNPPDHRALYPLEREFVYDLKRGLIYEDDTKVAIITLPKGKDQDPMLAWRIRQLEPMSNWIGRPNEIVTKASLNIIGEREVDGQSALIVEHSLSKTLTIVYIVIPSRGFLAVSQELRNDSTKKTLQKLEMSDLVEVLPGKWRAKRVMESTYSQDADELPARIIEQHELKFIEIKAVNVEKVDERFNLTVPDDAATVVDRASTTQPSGIEREKRHE